MRLLSKLLNDKVNTLVALLSLIVAITIGVLQFRSKVRELTCSVISSTELTSIQQVPGLASEFTYRDKKVTHLWKLNLNLFNSGTETLVGEGQHSNLIKDGVYFNFPNETEILNIEVISVDLPIQIIQTQPNLFALKFIQWRPDERANIAIYITSVDASPTPLIPQAVGRDIVDGNVIIKNPQTQPLPKKTLLDFLPGWAQFLMRVAVVLVCTLSMFIGLIILPRDFIAFVKLNSWKKRNKEELDRFFNEKSGAMKIYKDTPQYLPETEWEGFKGDKLNISQTLAFTSWLSVIPVSIGILIGISCLIFILNGLSGLFISS